MAQKIIKRPLITLQKLTPRANKSLIKKKINLNPLIKEKIKQTMKRMMRKFK